MISPETRAIAIALHHLMRNIQPIQLKQPLLPKNRSNHNKNRKEKKERNLKLTPSIPEKWKELKAILKLSKADLNKKNWKRKSFNWTLLKIHSLLTNLTIQRRKNRTKSNKAKRKSKLSKFSQNPLNRKKIMKRKSFLKSKRRRKMNKILKQLLKSSALLQQLMRMLRKRKRRRRKTKKWLNRKNPLRRSQFKNKK